MEWLLRIGTTKIPMIQATPKGATGIHYAQAMVNRRSFLARARAFIALSLAGVPARAEDAARALGRLWVSRPRRMGGQGLRALPAIPVDIPGIIDSLPKLLVRLLQSLPAKLALTNEYTINGRTTTAFQWLYERRDQLPRVGPRREGVGGVLRVAAAQHRAVMLAGPP